MGMEELGERIISNLLFIVKKEKEKIEIEDTKFWQENQNLKNIINVLIKCIQATKVKVTKKRSTKAHWNGDKF